MSTQREPTEGCHDLEIEQRRCVQFLTGQVAAQVIRAVDGGQRVNHGCAINDDRPPVRRRRSGVAFHAGRAERIKAEAFERSSRRAARSTTSSIVWPRVLASDKVKQIRVERLATRGRAGFERAARLVGHVPDLQ